MCKCNSQKLNSLKNFVSKMRKNEHAWKDFQLAIKEKQQENLKQKLSYQNCKKVW